MGYLVYHGEKGKTKRKHRVSISGDFTPVIATKNNCSEKAFFYGRNKTQQN